DVEVGASRQAALAGANPIHLVRYRARQQLRRERVVLPSRRGEQPDAFATRRGGHVTFVADEQRSVAGNTRGAAGSNRTAAARRAAGSARRTATDAGSARHSAAAGQ